jgi:hypothetical protein
VIEQFTNTEILLEGDSTTIVEEVLYIESVVLFTKPEDTLVIEKPHTGTVVLDQTQKFTSPPIFDLKGKQTWIC